MSREIKTDRLRHVIYHKIFYFYLYKIYGTFYINTVTSESLEDLGLLTITTKGSNYIRRITSHIKILKLVLKYFFLNILWSRVGSQLQTS